MQFCFPQSTVHGRLAPYSLSLLFVLSEKGLFGFSGLRSFSRSLATSVERACWGSSLQLPAQPFYPGRDGEEGGRGEWKRGFDQVSTYAGWTRRSSLRGSWGVFSPNSVSPEVFLSKSVYVDGTLGSEGQHAIVEACVSFELKRCAFESRHLVSSLAVSN